jgi:hypothetical protein
MARRKEKAPAETGAQVNERCPAVNQAVGRWAAWSLHPNRSHVLFPSPGLGEGRHRSLARLGITVCCAAYLAVLSSRPHPGPAIWRGWRQEDPSYHDVVLQHVVVKVWANRRAFEHQLAVHVSPGTRRETRGRLKPPERQPGQAQQEGCLSNSRSRVAPQVSLIVRLHVWVSAQSAFPAAVSGALLPGSCPSGRDDAAKSHRVRRCRQSPAPPPRTAPAIAALRPA